MGVLLGTPLPNPSGITGVMFMYVYVYVDFVKILCRNKLTIVYWQLNFIAVKLITIYDYLFSQMMLVLICSFAFKCYN